MSEFTLGPWKVGEEKKPMYAWRGQIIGTHPDYGEEFILASCNNNYPEMAIVNARLIASAPEMYEAIKAALCDDPDWRRLCVDALAKAEGRTK